MINKLSATQLRVHTAHGCSQVGSAHSLATFVLVADYDWMANLESHLSDSVVHSTWIFRFHKFRPYVISMVFHCLCYTINNVTKAKSKSNKTFSPNLNKTRRLKFPNPFHLHSYIKMWIKRVSGAESLHAY